MAYKSEVSCVMDAIRYWQSEEDAFEAIRKAVGSALEPDVRGSDNRHHKLSHARFLGTVLHDFVERLANAESWDKLEEISSVYPELDPRVERLQSEYLRLRAELRRLLDRLQQVCAVDEEACDETLGALHMFVQRVGEYRRREVNLLRDAFEQPL